VRESSNSPSSLSLRSSYAGHASPFGLQRGRATRSPKGEAWCPGRESYATTDTTNRCLYFVSWRKVLRTMAEVRYITSGAAVGRLPFCVRPTRSSDRALFRDDGSPRRRRSGRGRRDGEHDPRVPALGPVLGIELLVGLQVEISLHLSHGKQKSDLRTDPDNPRLKGADAITGPTIAGDLIIKIPGQSDRELLGQNCDAPQSKCQSTPL
jgi:hypothetical protein